MGFLSANWKWLVSGAAFIVFVAVQHGLYLSLIRACRVFKDAIDAGGNTPPSEKNEAGAFVWLQEVKAMFTQNGGWSENSPLPREAVIDLLDHEIWRMPRYSALQRWGLAAPLIGVILSALGFMVSPPELSGEVGDVMTKLGPLFVGVFVGALMALVNQLYLHYSAVELGRARGKAVRWFDEVIWKSIRQNAHNVLGQAAAETQSAAKSLEQSSQQLATCNLTYRDSLLELNRQLGLVRAAAQSTSSSFDGFSTMIADMTAQLGASIHNLQNLNATAAAVENGSVVWNVAASKMSNASAAMEESSRKFHEGIAGSAEGLSSVVSRLNEPLQKLEESIQQMQTHTDRHSELSAGLTATVEQSDRFLVERMAMNADDANLHREMATRIRAAIDGLRQLAETAGTVGTTGASLNLAAGGLREASTSIQNAARALAQPVKSLNDSIAQTGGENQALAEVSQRLENLTKMGERLLQDRAEETARGTPVEATNKRLEETAHILADSATTMRQIQHSLDALVGEIRLARESKEPHRGRWLSWLSSPRLKEVPDVENGIKAVNRTTN